MRPHVEKILHKIIEIIYYLKLFLFAYLKFGNVLKIFLSNSLQLSHLKKKLRYIFFANFPNFVEEMILK